MQPPLASTRANIALSVHRILAIVMVCTVALMLPVGHLHAQQPQTPPTFESTIAGTWRSLHDKILTMAKDTLFPDNRLESKPHADSRTVLDEYRHVTIGLEMSAAQLRGERFDYAARLAADERKPKTRASVVADMEAAIAASYPLVTSRPAPSLIFWIEHQAEHYGKLVSNYRLNGIVPPVSRPRPR